MKNTIKSAIVGGIAAVFVASVAIAGGQAPGDGQGRRGMGPGGPGGPGGRGAFPGIMRELTDEQRQQVRSILEQRREDGAPAEAKLRRELDAELLADSPNDQKIEELRQQIIAATGESLTRHITTQKQIAGVLTAEQRAKARERLAAAPHRGGRPGR